MFQPIPVFVGLRYSLAREHSFFVSFITWVSLLGVALGVAALITVLSVMNGFESELRSRLLSVSAHAVLHADGAPIGESMHDGKLSDLQPGLNRIILGRVLAYQLQVGVGDTVTVMIPSGGAHGADGGAELVPRLQDFEVAGTFEVGLQERDGVIALVNLTDAEALRGLDGPTGIRLKFDDVLNAPQLARAAAK